MTLALTLVPGADMLPISGAGIGFEPFPANPAGPFAHYGLPPFEGNLTYQMPERKTQKIRCRWKPRKVRCENIDGGSRINYAQVDPQRVALWEEERRK